MLDPYGTLKDKSPVAGRSALQTCLTEHRLKLSFGLVSVSQYRWEHSTDDLWTLDSHFLDFSLTPRPRPAWARFVSGQQSSAIQLGKIMFVPAGQTVQSGAAVGSQRSLTVALAPSLFAEILGYSPVWDTAALVAGLQLGGAELKWLLLKIHDEFERPSFASDLMIESLVRTLSISLIRQFAFDQTVLRAARAGGLAPWRLRRIRERIHAAEAPPCLQELADLCDISVRHLTRAFRAETGQTISGYVQEVTIERARTLLAASAKPVAEIARELGFSSSTSFSYAFRRATGQRPRECVRRSTFKGATSQLPDAGADGEVA